MADLKHKRGTKKTHSVHLIGDHTNRELSFVVKNGLAESKERVIEKLKSRGEISASYDSASNITTCLIQMIKTDTVDLPVQTYPWDIDSINTNDAEDVETVEGGNYILQQDVQTPYDSYGLPANATRVQQVDATNAGNLELNIVKTINGVKKYEFISLTELAGYLKPILDNL
jgi:hypothetical protein